MSSPSEGWQRWIGHAGFLLVVALGVLAPVSNC
jgi:hypothetical protein